ncbi:MAG: PIN domain-containing protein [Cyclobacteriaceae bacterium]
MPRIFLDTDIALDIITQRNPHNIDSNSILRLSSQSLVSLVLSESCVPNLIYIATESYKIDGAYDLIIDLVNSCQLVSSGKKSILAALKSDFIDKEDAVQYYTALQHDIDYFITRNKKDYEKFVKEVPVFTPSEFLTTVRKSHPDKLDF